jgi:hypothetical protein
MMAYRGPEQYVTGVINVTDVTGEASEAQFWRVRRPEWVAHVLDDSVDPPRAVLLHLPSGRRTALSDTGTRVWQVIVASGADGTDGVNIGAVLGPEYAVDPTIVTHDVAGLVAEMVEGEWLEVVPDREQPAGVGGDER